MAEMYTKMPTLADRVAAKLEETGITKAKLAMKCGVSRAVMSNYLNERPVSASKEKQENMERFLEEWLGSVGEAAVYENWQSRARSGNAAVDEEPLAAETPPAKEKQLAKTEYFQSADFRGVIGLCTLCQENQELGIVVGRSGYGKTYSLKYFSRLPRVVHMECNETMNCKDIVRKIERCVGLPKGYGSIDERLERVYDFFNANAGYLLIVDEADKLLSKYTIKKIELIRNIADCSKVGIVLAGEPTLESSLKAYDNRFANRMDLIYRLRGLSKKEVERYFAGYPVEPAALEEFYVRACNKTTGCFRLLDRTVNNVIRILKNNDQKTVTYEVIAEASGMMIL